MFDYVFTWEDALEKLADAHPRRKQLRNAIRNSERRIETKWQAGLEPAVTDDVMSKSLTSPVANKVRTERATNVALLGIGKGNNNKEVATLLNQRVRDAANRQQAKIDAKRIAGSTSGIKNAPPAQSTKGLYQGVVKGKNVSRQDIKTLNYVANNPFAGVKNPMAAYNNIDMNKLRAIGATANSKLPVPVAPEVIDTVAEVVPAARKSNKLRNLGIAAVGLGAGAGAKYGINKYLAHVRRQRNLRNAGIAAAGLGALGLGGALASKTRD